LAPPEIAEVGTEFDNHAKSEIFLDPTPEQELQQIGEFRKPRVTELTENREFPDEIELHLNALTRERLGRYGGLKSHTLKNASLFCNSTLINSLSFRLYIRLKMSRQYLLFF